MTYDKTRISCTYAYVPLMTTDASCDASISFQADTSAVTSIAGLEANSTYRREKNKKQKKRGNKGKEREKKWWVRRKYKKSMSETGSELVCHLSFPLFQTQHKINL